VPAVVLSADVAVAAVHPYQIDWNQPWNQPWRASGEAVSAALAQGQALHDALNGAGPAPVLFVPQQQLPAGTPYEQFVRETRQCPTRDGLHDFFNGLCWIRFPQVKTRLNELQAQQIASHGIRPERGATRDAGTLFDENAALLAAPDPVWDALRAKDWETLFGRLRPLWGDVRLNVFGHALLEKLQQPRKAITAHVYRVPGHAPTDSDLDVWLAHDLTASRLAEKPYAHLPLLGVPGWCSGNEDAAFYADAQVFRPPRAQTTAVQ